MCKNVHFATGISLSNAKQKKCFISLNDETNKALEKVSSLRRRAVILDFLILR